MYYELLILSFKVFVLAECIILEIRFKKLENDHVLYKSSSQVTAALSGNLHFSGKQLSKHPPHV